MTIEPFVPPAWMIAKVDQRLALMDEAMSEALKEAADVVRKAIAPLAKTMPGIKVPENVTLDDMLRDAGKFDAR